MEQKIRSSEVKAGMYVSSLDRPWLDTPFLIQGFYVTSDDEILTLRKYCDHVVIDTSLCANSCEFIDNTPRFPTNNRLENYLEGGTKQIEYKRVQTASEEMPEAKSALENARGMTLQVLEDFASGEKLDIAGLKTSIDPVIESVLRNPDAMMWLIQIKDKSPYVYARAINNCVIGITFGRHMGLPKSDLRTLSMGLLLMDVGMSSIPDEILNKNAVLTTEEHEMVKRHVENGVEILTETKGISQDIINIALTHHERFDGSGYPAGLVGKQTPVYGRIAAIIDCYDAMITRRTYSEAVSQHKVLQQIYNWRNKYFQNELVEQFLQCLGVYPTGSLVELNTGEVAIVLSQNPLRRFRPHVMIVLDADKEPYPVFTAVDLDAQNIEDDGHELIILQSLDPDAYGIEPSDYYL